MGSFMFLFYTINNLVILFLLVAENCKSDLKKTNTIVSVTRSSQEWRKSICLYK